jgi:hypothetical protein
LQSLNSFFEDIAGNPVPFLGNPARSRSCGNLLEVSFEIKILV